MSTQLKLRRGSTADHGTFVGASGEITVDTSKKTVVVHDGVTSGGTPLLTDTAGSVVGNNIQTNAITADKIAPGAVGSGELGGGVVNSSHIENGAVTTEKLADGSVTTDKLSNSGVVPGDYASASITVDAKGRVTGISSGGGYVGYRSQIFLESGTFTVPPGITGLKVTVVGGGGGGGSATGSSATRSVGGGGGAGGMTIAFLSNLTPGTNIPVNVGAGGAAATNGGASTFNSVVVAWGGTAGTSNINGASSVRAAGGNGGFGGSLGYIGGTGGPGYVEVDGVPYTHFYAGSGGGLGGNDADLSAAQLVAGTRLITSGKPGLLGGRGGDSKYQTTSGVTSSVTGNTASGFGNGGGGAIKGGSANAVGGAGSPGIVIVEW